MNTVTVRASRQYDILIGHGLLPTLGAEAKKLGKAQKICVVSESSVYPLYGAAAEESLKSAGFSVVSYVFPAGEESKNGQVFLDLLNFLAENRLTRSDMIVALGGKLPPGHPLHSGSHDPACRRGFLRGRQNSH